MRLRQVRMRAFPSAALWNCELRPGRAGSLSARRWFCQAGAMPSDRGGSSPARLVWALHPLGLVTSFVPFLPWCSPSTLRGIARGALRPFAGRSRVVACPACCSPPSPWGREPWVGRSPREVRARGWVLSAPPAAPLHKAVAGEAGCSSRAFFLRSVFQCRGWTGGFCPRHLPSVRRGGSGAFLLRTVLPYGEWTGILYQSHLPSARRGCAPFLSPSFPLPSIPGAGWRGRGFPPAEERLRFFSS